ncbi:MAG: c-type cytochrome [Burkholderiales bacterium]|nr:c-type cytochrome [Burkholderiales bacterium]
MREFWVRIVAAIAGTGVVLLALAFAWLQNPHPPAAAPAAAPPAAPAAALVEAGRAFYAAEGCAMCHAIAGEGNPRFPLDGVGARRDAAELRDWILATGTAAEALSARAVRMKQGYRALGEAELEALVAYMQSLTTPSLAP